MEKSNRHLTDLVFMIALICVFAVSSVMLIALGINIYSETILNTAADFEARTCQLYIAEKIRQSDFDGAVSCGSVENTSALVLKVEYGEFTYQTWIFCDGQHLREVSAVEGSEVSLSDGQPILECKNFTVEEKDGYFTVLFVSAQGVTSELIISPRSLTGEAAYE